MAYTFTEYQAFYYIHKLLPMLEDSWNFKEGLMQLNSLRTGGLLTSIPSKDCRKDEDDEEYMSSPCGKFIDAVVDGLKKQSVFYAKQPKTYRQKNVDYLARVFGLKKAEQYVLDFLMAVDNNPILGQYLHRNHFGSRENHISYLEAVAGIPAGTGDSLLGPQSRLAQLGILCFRSVRDVYLTKWAGCFLNTRHKDNAARHLALLGKTADDEYPLAPEDFTYVEGAAFACALIKKAAHTKGFNLLLYGNPGTGKTSFAKMLARLAKLELFGVGEDSNGEVEKNFRLCQLYRKQHLLGKTKNTCLIFDEAEDIFSSSKLTTENKVSVNRLLENNARPVIWTTNQIWKMDPAFIRRFTLAVHFDKPPRPVREKMWLRHLQERKLVVPPAEVTRLAKTYDVPPAMIAGAVHAARLVNGNLNKIEEHLTYTMQALNGGYKKSLPQRQTDAFCPALIHADTDLAALTGQLKQLGRLNFSLCLYGASGTGKSAYARYLAAELGLDVLHRRASDLLDMYVGGTEHKIAAAFAEAKRAKAMLIFDEADSFLRDRSLAAHSWEVSGVNEMLTWMECHPYPFICTTNLMDTLDPASLRRFNFKVKYDFLTPQQVCEAFRYFFGLQVNEPDVRELRKLTPGDFAVVKSKAEILGQTAFEPLRDMLELEQRAKDSKADGRIGFCSR